MWRLQANSHSFLHMWWHKTHDTPHIRLAKGYLGEPAHNFEQLQHAWLRRGQRLTLSAASSAVA